MASPKADNRNSKYLPQLAVDQVPDPHTRKNFQNLSSFFDREMLLIGFKFVEFSLSGKVEKEKVAHGLGYIPRDILITNITGPGVVTFNYSRFTDEFISVTSTGACKVRAFMGTYKKGVSDNSLGDADLQNVSSGVTESGTVTSGFSNPMTAVGDTIVGGTGGTPLRQPRISAMAYTTTTGTATSTAPVNFHRTGWDTANGIQPGSNWAYRIPVSGRYEISGRMGPNGTPGLGRLALYVNGLPAQQIGHFNGAANSDPLFLAKIALTAGDLVSIRTDAAYASYPYNGGSVSGFSASVFYIDLIGP